MSLNGKSVILLNGEDEFGDPARFASMGRIKIDYEGKIRDMPNGLPITVRDEMITEVALNNNAIMPMSNTASPAKVNNDSFVICILSRP